MPRLDRVLETVEHDCRICDRSRSSMPSRSRPCESRDPYAVPYREETAYGSPLRKRAYARLRRAMGRDDPESEGADSTSLDHALVTRMDRYSRLSSDISRLLGVSCCDEHT